MPNEFAPIETAAEESPAVAVLTDWIKWGWLPPGLFAALKQVVSETHTPIETLSAFENLQSSRPR